MAGACGLLRPAPMDSLRRGAEYQSVQNLCQNLSRSGMTIARTAEKEIPVRESNPAVAHGAEAVPPRVGFEHRPFCARPLEVKAAWRHNQELRISGRNLLTRNRPRILVLASDQQFAVRGLYQFGHPVPRREDRVGPLQDNHGTPDAIRRFPAHRVQATPLPFDDGTALRLPADHARDFADAFVDFLDRAGAQSEDGSRRPFAPASHDVGRSHRADFTMRLRDDQVGRQLPDETVVDPVQRFARPEPAFHFGVNLAARPGDVERGLAAPWKRLNPWWIVALVRTSHQGVASAQGANDFGGACQQRDDAHPAPLPSVLHTAGRPRREKQARAPAIVTEPGYPG